MAETLSVTLTVNGVIYLPTSTLSTTEITTTNVLEIPEDISISLSESTVSYFADAVTITEVTI